MSDRKAFSGSRGLPSALCQRLRKLFLAAVDLYAVLLVLYFLLRIVFGDRLWPVALFSTFLHHLLLPAFIFLPVMLRVRRWPTAVMLAVGVAAFLWLFGGLFFPQLSAPAHTGILTVMTYNVANDSIAPGDLVSVLRASGADIIALQELSGEHATAIERDLGDLYPHQALHGYGIPGKGLLSRYPILEEELFYLEAHRLPYLRTVVAVDGEGWGQGEIDVTVIVAHPPPPEIGRLGYSVNPHAVLEITSLAQMSKAGGPSILMGDFNMVDQSDNYHILADAGLKDAFRAAGWGFGATWPARRMEPLQPVVRLDYIWYSPHIQAVRAWVGPEAGSDHLPVFAELVWHE
ncbi:MAG: endonuclease/exonuclease/phosphatase family protein [Anaerolineae bacterium]|jgi:vancomycin resistance protein VanJ